MRREYRNADKGAALCRLTKLHKRVEFQVVSPDAAEEVEMSELRKKVIRLAYHRPDLRADLLPLLSRQDKMALQLPNGKIVLDKLNSFLRNQMTAIAQYMVHSEMCANWGYSKLAAAGKARAMTEMRHAEALIERIIFLEGTPIVGLLNEVFTGKIVPEQLQLDLEAEQKGIAGYNEGIAICNRVQDHGTRQLLEANLKDEEGHHDWLASQLDQLNQMGVGNYLAAQMG